ncbi:MAG TPA: DedA family protein [Anaerolineales bacterium]|jgi:membrane-associated protein|nr:DedA family protein [Anaerolineales bacterium]
MEFILQIVDFIVHIDVHLAQIIQDYNTWTYGILFAIVFAETGFVVTPFLPGDSLIFAAATFAAKGALNPWLIFITMTTAGIIGDGVNYSIGHYIGPRVFTEDMRFLKREYLDKAHEFFEKHGGKAVVLARFMPIVRTFVPFVAGAGSMTYSKFVVYNVFGAVVWVGLFTVLGYFFGTIPAVEENFTFVIFAIIILSILPPIFEAVRERNKAKQLKASTPESE